MADLILKLGDFVFQGFEMPESIPFGGTQRLAVHRLIGGGKVIDAMGRDDEPVRWHGWFRGLDATQRARYLDNLRVDGRPLKLTWHEFSYRVVVRSFHADFQRFHQIPYQIECEVLENLTQPVTALASPGIDSVFGADLAALQNLVNMIADNPLVKAVESVTAAMSQIPGLSGVSREILNKVIVPLQTAQDRVNVLIGATNSVLQAGAILGGVVSGGGASTAPNMATSLTDQTAAFGSMGNLLNASALIGRMSTNLAGLTSGVKTVTMAGGNLYDLAAKEFGDATQWANIARANNLADPVITGVQEIQIPAAPDTSGGVLTV